MVAAKVLIMEKFKSWTTSAFSSSDRLKKIHENSSLFDMVDFCIKSPRVVLDMYAKQFELLDHFKSKGGHVLQLVIQVLLFDNWYYFGLFNPPPTGMKGGF